MPKPMDMPIKAERPATKADIAWIVAQKQRSDFSVLIQIRQTAALRDFSPLYDRYGSCVDGA
jgi:hypothetical protein